MRRINRLDDLLISTIASGEVVERPASVVKELVENSIDSGAKNIEIHVSNYGKRLIIVKDDGCGMSREDLELSVQRYTTSKISSIDDLKAISTLGFRGEALFAICSVSRVIIKTRRREDETGTLIRIHGGQVEEIKQIGFPTGTQVEVRDLFFNTPVRLKFLSSPSVELGHIVDTVTKYALCWLQLNISLTHNGRSIISTESHCDHSERVAILLGERCSEKLMKLNPDAQIGSGKSPMVWGYICSADVTKSNPSGIYLFVNRRPVRDKIIQSAIINSYRPMIPEGRFPVVVLHINISPDEVDVNVHPQKTEVRFSNKASVYRAVERSLQDALKNFITAGGKQRYFLVDKLEKPTHSYESTYAKTGIFTVKETGIGLQESHEQKVSEPSDSIKVAPEVLKTNELQFICHIMEEFALFSDDENIVMMDLHAAHERVLFEQLIDDYRNEKRSIQPMLFPIMVNLARRDFEIINENLKLISKIGIELEPFGSSTFRICGVSKIMERINLDSILQDIADEISLCGTAQEHERMIQKIISRIACHCAYRGRSCSMEKDATSILKMLLECNNPSFCPHGRPTVVVLDSGRIRKMFKRGEV